jgi:hypothetical protein
MFVKTVLKSLKLSFLIITVSAHPLMATQFGNHYNIIGFDSEDKIFAFQAYDADEYGEGAQWYTFFVDLENDRWIEDSPFVTGNWDGGRSKDETQKVAKIIKRLGIRDYGFTAAIRSDIQSNGTILKWAGINQHVPALGSDYNYVQIEQFDFDQTDNFGTPCRGYRLIHNGFVVHSDRWLPESRGCPRFYSLREVYCSGYYDYTSGYCAVIVQYNIVDMEAYHHKYFLANPIRY